MKIKDAIDAVMQMFRVFEDCLQDHPSISYTVLVASFEVMYARLDPQSRASVREVVLKLMDDIGDEKFEDAQDFVSFLDDLTEERANEAGQ